LNGARQLGFRPGLWWRLRGPIGIEEFLGNGLRRINRLG
jgi:hypothetical protein